MDDLISRQAAIKTIEQANGALYWNETLKENLVSVVKSVPTIDPVKRGKWIKISERNYKCSCCGAWWTVDRDSTIKDFKFCPNCGAQTERSEE